MRLLLTTIVVLAMVCIALPADTQQAPTPNCTPGRPLLTVPEIVRTGTPGQPGRLQGMIILSDEQRSLAGGGNGTPCDSPQLRYFKGAVDTTPPWPSTGDPLPGRVRLTLRSARRGPRPCSPFLNQSREQVSQHAGPRISRARPRV